MKKKNKTDAGFVDRTHSTTAFVYRIISSVTRETKRQTATSDSFCCIYRHPVCFIFVAHVWTLSEIFKVPNVTYIQYLNMSRPYIHLLQRTRCTRITTRKQTNTIKQNRFFSRLQTNIIQMGMHVYIYIYIYIYMTRNSGYGWIVFNLLALFVFAEPNCYYQVPL